MSENNKEFHPKGTMAVLLIFVLTMILLWGSIFMILLSRGVTI